MQDIGLQRRAEALASKVLLILCLSVLSCPAAAKASDVDGVWRGEFEIAGRVEDNRYKKPQTALLDLTVVRGYGEAVFGTENLEGIGRVNCQYVFQLKESQPDRLVLNHTQQTSSACPQQPKLTLERVGASELTVRIRGFAPLVMMRLYPLVRPVRDADRAAMPEGFDILGLVPGQSRAAIEASLAEKGYVKKDKWTATDGNVVNFRIRGDKWKSDINAYSKVTAGDEGSLDNIVVHYTARTAEFDEPQKSYAITRRWDVAEQNSLTAQSMSEALTKKYGPPIAHTNRAYDRRGINIATLEDDELECFPSTLHVISFTPYTAGKKLKREKRTLFSANCGHEAKIDVFVRSGPTPDIRYVKYVIAMLMNVDELLHHHWRTSSIAQRDRIKTIFDHLTSARESVPVL